MSEHGMVGHYRHAGCRCDACTAAMRESQQAYRDRRKAGIAGSGRGPDMSLRDEDGNVRCRGCEQWKPPDQMASRPRRDGSRRVLTICKRCARRNSPWRTRYRKSPEYLEYQRRLSFARHRAHVALAEKYPAEYERLRLSILENLTDVEVVAMRQVSAHDRAVFAWPEFELGDSPC